MPPTAVTDAGVKPVGHAETGWTTKSIVGAVCAIAALFLVWFSPLPVEPRAKHALAVSAFMVVLWATEAFDLGITGLIGCYLFWILGIAKVEIAFSGFHSDTTWFMLGALLIGTMTSVSGIGRRVGYSIVARAGSKYSMILLGVIIADLLLAFFVPSGVARIIIVASLAIGLIEAFKVGKDSNMARGLFIILTYSATIFDKMLLANAPVILSRGIIKSVGGVEVQYSTWFLAYLPVCIITVLAAWLITLWLYPPEVKEVPGGAAILRAELAKMGPWTLNEKKAAFLVSTAIALWLTDSWHHQSPSAVGLGIGLIALIPGIGFLTYADFRKINLSVFFLVGTAICMTEVLSDTKATDFLTQVMFSWMAPYITNVYSSTLVLYWTAFVYHIFLAVDTSMLATSMPPLMRFAVNNHLNPLTVGMLWVFAAGGKIFIYQSAALITGYAYGYFRPRDVMIVGSVLTVFESIIILIVVPIWWPMIGLL